jgi:hypothetical protein
MSSTVLWYEAWAMCRWTLRKVVTPDRRELTLLNNADVPLDTKGCPVRWLAYLVAYGKQPYYFSGRYNWLSDCLNLGCGLKSYLIFTNTVESAHPLTWAVWRFVVLDRFVLCRNVIRDTPDLAAVSILVRVFLALAMDMLADAKTESARFVFSFIAIKATC